MLLIDQRLAHILVGDVEIDTDHQSTATNIYDMLLRLLQLLQLGNQVFANLMGILHKIFLFEDVEHGQCCCTGQMIASESGAQLSVDGLELRRDQHAAHRETVGDTLGYRDDVGTNAQPLVGEELTAAAVTTLDLIANQDRTVFLAGSCQALGKLGRSQFDAAHTLNALQGDHYR